MEIKQITTHCYVVRHVLCGIIFTGFGETKGVAISDLKKLYYSTLEAYEELKVLSEADIKTKECLESYKDTIDEELQRGINE